MTPREYGHNCILLKSNRWRVESVDENDRRRALNIGYDLLNLLTGRKATGGELKASYLLMNGIKGT